MQKPILIAGAGPTGLMLANCLAVYGVPFEIIDRKIGPSNDSKALAVNLLSQYALSLLGKDDVLGSDGCHVRRVNVFWEQRRLSAIDFRWLDFPLRSFVTQPQASTERELAAALPANVNIQWQTELVELMDHGKGVTATLRNAKGDELRRPFEYVIGCEGKNSISREAIGSTLEGWDYPMHFLLGDFPLAWDRPNDQAYYHVFPDTFFVIVPIGATRWRVVVKRDGAFDPQRAFRSSDITEMVDRYLGPGLFAADAAWVSGAPFYMRVASSLQRGRIFICGDAAHLFSPIGGTGMNTGMLDAFDLAWRLAYVHHGHAAPEALLPSFSEERREAIERGAAAADGATRLIARLDRAAERIGPLLPQLRNRKLLTGVLPFRQAGFGLEYTRSSVIDYQRAEGALQPGAMCLSLPALRRAIELQSGLRVDALSLLVVAFVAAENERAHATQVRELLAELEWRYSAPIRATVVLFGAGACAQGKAAHLVLKDESLLRSMGARDGALIAIRPDAVLAFCATLEERLDLIRLLDRQLLVANAAPSQAARVS